MSKPSSSRKVGRGVAVATVVVLVLRTAAAAAAAVPTPTPTQATWAECWLSPMPDTAPPGTTVGLVGTCYPIHSGRPGAIYFDDILMARVRGDTPGSYSAGVVVPADATMGTHEITLRAGEDDGPIVGRVAFDVLPFCRGDCDGDGRVTVAEVLLGINVALGRQSTGVCPMADPDQDGTVSIDELIVAVEDLLSGCIVEFTPTPTPRDTPTPVALGGPCRDTGECQEARLLCLVPGRFAGCVECQALTSEC